MSSTPERLVVSNTSPLLYLHQAGQLDLMRRLYERIWIPPPVIDSLKETTMYLTPHLIEMVLAEADEI